MSWEAKIKKLIKVLKNPESSPEAVENAYEKILCMARHLDHLQINEENQITYTIVSDYDANDYFEVKSTNVKDAALEALECLGWRLCVTENDDCDN